MLCGGGGAGYQPFWLMPAMPFCRGFTMLILSRKCTQRIYIGDNIIVTVVEVRGEKVRIGIEAPAEVPVHREEIYKQIKESEKGDA